VTQGGLKTALYMCLALVGASVLVVAQSSPRQVECPVVYRNLVIVGSQVPAGVRRRFDRTNARERARHL